MPQRKRCYFATSCKNYFYLLKGKHHLPKVLLCRFCTCWIFHISCMFGDQYAMLHTIRRVALRTIYSLVCMQPRHTFVRHLVFVGNDLLADDFFPPSWL